MFDDTLKQGKAKEYVTGEDDDRKIKSKINFGDSHRCVCELQLNYQKLSRCTSLTEFKEQVQANTNAYIRFFLFLYLHLSDLKLCNAFTGP